MGKPVFSIAHWVLGGLCLWGGGCNEAPQKCSSIQGRYLIQYSYPGNVIAAQATAGQVQALPAGYATSVAAEPPATTPCYLQPVVARLDSGPYGNHTQVDDRLDGDVETEVSMRGCTAQVVVSRTHKDTKALLSSVQAELSINGANIEELHGTGTGYTFDGYGQLQCESQLEMHVTRR